MKFSGNLIFNINNVGDVSWSTKYQLQYLVGFSTITIVNCLRLAILSQSTVSVRTLLH